MDRRKPRDCTGKPTEDMVASVSCSKDVLNTRLQTTTFAPVQKNLSSVAALNGHWTRSHTQERSIARVAPRDRKVATHPRICRTHPAESVEQDGLRAGTILDDPGNPELTNTRPHRDACSLKTASGGEVIPEVDNELAMHAAERAPPMLWNMSIGPTPQREEHCRTHEPHRAWCHACMAEVMQTGMR